jgi:hypothetical protein
MGFLGLFCPTAWGKITPKNPYPELRLIIFRRPLNNEEFYGYPGGVVGAGVAGGGVVGAGVAGGGVVGAGVAGGG